MKKTLWIALLALALGGCAASQQAAAPAADKEYDDLVAKAKAEIRLANNTGFLWRDTEKSLKDADAAAKAGERDKAIKLVKKAAKEAQLAQQQARDNADAKPVF